MKRDLVIIQIDTACDALADIKVMIF